MHHVGLLPFQLSGRSIRSQGSSISDQVGDLRGKHRPVDDIIDGGGTLRLVRDC
jgi:hypothetical protein